jgi:hypothetical protein
MEFPYSGLVAVGNSVQLEISNVSRFHWNIPFPWTAYGRARRLPRGERMPGMEFKSPGVARPTVMMHPQRSKRKPI